MTSSAGYLLQPTTGNKQKSHRLRKYETPVHRFYGYLRSFFVTKTKKNEDRLGYEIGKPFLQNVSLLS